MTGTFWAFIPPVIAIVLALITKEVYSSLFIGILCGSIFYAGFNSQVLDVVVKDGITAAVADSAGIFIFLVVLGIIVVLLNKAGGSAAFGHWAEKHVKSRSGALFSTFVLGILIFVDDYFNCLTVGSVMRPLTDKHKISREKLAYIIDATAAPICMIAPISSWAAAVSNVVDNYSGFELFVKAIPYNFYSLLTIAMLIFLCKTQMDFGPMKKYETAALYNKNTDVIDNIDKENNNSKVIDLILPIIVLIISCIIGLIYSGGFFEGKSFIEAFGDCDSFVGLPWGALIALIFTIIYLICRKLITFKETMECIPQGFNAMVPPILILTLATALKNVTSLLGAREFAASLMHSGAKELFLLLPAIIYIVAGIMAFATGTSWGTFSILIPIVTEVFPADSELLIIGVSACLAGAVFGDHISPISDTTIMASAGAQCNHIDHVSTQIPYAFIPATVSFICYLLAGFIQNSIGVLIFGIVAIALILYSINRFTEKRTVIVHSEI